MLEHDHIQKPMEALMNKALKVVFSLTAMLAAGCSDGALTAPKSDGPGEALMAKGGTPGKPRAASDTSFFDFSFNAHNGTTLDFGHGNSVNIPAGVICDPSTSGYGPSYWDRPCNTTNATIKLTVKVWIDENQHPRIDFNQDLRFLPTTDASKFVVVTFADQKAANAFGTDILYCRSSTTGCIKESNNDATMATVVDPGTGQVRRRVKHFSGYSITTGDDNSRGDTSMNRAKTGGLKIQP
jgi:hypothetical protein